jgi:hypothetical protein
MSALGENALEQFRYRSDLTHPARARGCRGYFDHGLRSRFILDASYLVQLKLEIHSFEALIERTTFRADCLAMELQTLVTC